MFKDLYKAISQRLITISSMLGLFLLLNCYNPTNCLCRDKKVFRTLSLDLNTYIAYVIAIYEK